MLSTSNSSEPGEHLHRQRSPSHTKQYLLDLDLGAGIRQLLDERVCICLVDTFLHRLRSTVDEILGFLQPETRNFTHRLDDVHLVLTGSGKDYREFGLFLNGRDG